MLAISSKKYLLVSIFHFSRSRLPLASFVSTSAPGGGLVEDAADLLSASASSLS